MHHPIYRGYRLVRLDEVRHFPHGVQADWYITGPRGTELRPNRKGQITVMYNGKRLSKHARHVCLECIHGTLKHNMTVDEINNNHKDWSISNLQWLTAAENIRKQNKLNRQGAKGRKIQNTTTGHVYLSLSEAAHKNQVSKTAICTALRNGTQCLSSAWAYVNDADDDDEVWKYYKNTNWQVSTKGRVQNMYGRKFRGRLLRAGEKARVVSIEGKTVYVHRMVYEVFKGEIPSSLVVCHAEGVFLQDGTYRNYVEDLHLGTQSQNVVESHHYRKTGLQLPV